MTVCGTRPEAIKLAPVIRAAIADPSVEHALCVTGQHRQMLDQVLNVFGLKPDFDLDLMRTDQSLDQVAGNVVSKVSEVIDAWSPDWVIVQGDTMTAFGAALAAYLRRVKVAHVEAGLRTGDLYSPWPEEGNRRLVGQLAAVHFPPTDLAAANLLSEGVGSGKILVTGNTVIDALHWTAGMLAEDEALTRDLQERFSFIDPSKRLVLVTGHRRENFDGGLERVCRALVDVAQRGDVTIVYPVHLNPNVQETAQRVLSATSAVHLIEPLDYLSFVFLMRRAHIIVTDSGGIQEEAPGLGKPVLVTRETTERPEAIEAGTARLLGTSSEALVAALTELLDDADAYAGMARAQNPFGDGQASGRIVSRILQESELV